MEDDINKYGIFILNNCLQSNFKLQDTIKNNKIIIVELENTIARYKFENHLLDNRMLILKNGYVYYKMLSIILSILFIIYTIIFNFNYLGINNILKI